MELLKRLFRINKEPSDSWRMFRASKSEAKELLVSLGDLTIGDDYLNIENYPFEPSIAYRQSTFIAHLIQDIDYKSYPPTFRIENELIFLSAEKKIDLGAFAKMNNIRTVERPGIWGWILEPFLDTEFTSTTDQRLTSLLGKYGLTAVQVESLRAEVKTQMLKYNFDTMLWEWGGLDASDVLRAMRTKYNRDKFSDFYKRVMKVALLTQETGQ